MTAASVVQVVELVLVVQCTCREVHSSTAGRSTVTVIGLLDVPVLLAAMSSVGNHGSSWPNQSLRAPVG